uniref:Nephrocystin-4 n=1 Tax=Setaria digitata TaxID=48799 RepID=A0A915PNX2_9BILA
MFKDESQVTEWYQRVQMCRRVPPRRSQVNGYGKPECYALSIRNAQLPNLKMDMSYRIHAYFYDRQRKYFFGKPFYGAWYRSEFDSVLLAEVIFFWCSFVDDIDVVLELVKAEQMGENTSLYTAAWTSVPLENTENKPEDYTSCHEPFFRRLPLYSGSPKALFFMFSETEVTDFPRKTNTGLEICLQVHQKMFNVLNFIPEWYMFGHWEDIPGLRTFYHGESQTVLPEVMKSQTSILKALKVTFGTDVCNFEQILLHLINNDRLYRANKSPADINVKLMEVLERRIIIGVHNGLCYVDKPQCLHFSSAENHRIYGTSEMKQNKDATKSNLISESQTLAMNGSVILNRVIVDPRFAIIFSLDYLVGIYSYDGTAHSSQSVMVCWGAWCPFAVNAIPDDTITISLFGGPNVNPEERLAFRNSIAFRYDLPFCDQFSGIKLTFKYAEFREEEKPLDVTLRSNSESKGNPVKISNSESVELQSNLIRTTRNPEPLRNGTSLLSSSIPEDEKRVAKTAFDDERKCNTYTSVKMYSMPLVRTSNIPRGCLAVLANVTFSTITDRNGNKPKLVDIENFPAPDINIELNDKLNTNEAIVQFMAIKISCGDEQCLKIPIAVFFTMEFYRFHTVTTERLLLDPVHTNPTLREQLFILKRSGNIEGMSSENCNGFTVKFTINWNSLPDGDEEDYINYLLNGHAIVDVWDADSLLPLGKAYVPLKFLLRHGSEAVQADIQSAVVLNNFPEPFIVTCQILLRLANVGHPTVKQIDSARSRTSAIVSRHLTRIGQDEHESYRIRAKPLNPIHENSLQRFLTAQRLDINKRYNEIMNSAVPGIKNRNSVVKPLITKGSVKRYLLQQELEAYKKLRDEDKASKLLKVVFKAITTEYRIYPKCGQVIFFEYVLQNTELESAIIVVDIAHSTLKPLRDVELWQYYKNMYGIETPLERDLYQISEENEQTTEVYIFLKPMETIYAPFIYDGFQLRKQQSRNQVKVVFKKKNTGEPIAILDLLAENRHNIISNSFRFYYEAERTISRIIHITGYKSHVFGIRCTDPLVLCSFKNNGDGSQDLHFTCQTGKAPMLRTFKVIFFADQYYNTVLGAWLIHVHAINQINLNAIRAQLIKIPIFLKVADSYNGLIHFGNSFKNFEIYPSDAAVVQNSTGTLDAVINFLPNFTGTRTMLVSATDQRTNHLLNQWMIVANVQEANITKMFEVHLQNSLNQTIVLIFVTNMENNLQEEAYSLKLIYPD